MHSVAPLVQSQQRKLPDTKQANVGDDDDDDLSTFILAGKDATSVCSEASPEWQKRAGNTSFFLITWCKVEAYGKFRMPK